MLWSNKHNIDGWLIYVAPFPRFRVLHWFQITEHTAFFTKMQPSLERKLAHRAPEEKMLGQETGGEYEGMRLFVCWELKCGWHQPWAKTATNESQVKSWRDGAVHSFCLVPNNGFQHVSQSCTSLTKGLVRETFWNCLVLSFALQNKMK